MFTDLRASARRFSQQRDLRAIDQACQRLLSARGEASSPTIARQIIQQVEALPDDPKAPGGLNDFFLHLARHFSPDPSAVLAQARAYAETPDAQQLIRLMELAEPPRQELFRRINRAPGGTAALIRLRRSLLDRLPKAPELRAVEADLLHLLSSWFNPGFLELRRVSWQSPAQLLEQIIRHEAVHEIDGWDDLRRRLQPDRRCFAFFHPQLPDEPLIFVEVALVPEMASAIAPLIDKRSQPLPPDQHKVAVFYSISNCQPGLRGVSLGNFLIKRVAEALKAELPQLRQFCTLSPIPGFLAWLQRADQVQACLGLLKPKRQAALEDARQRLQQACGGELAALGRAGIAQGLGEDAQQALMRLCALYLAYHSPQAGGDPVARFHLDNGARLERVNLNGNLSAKGLKQSAGLMVNYLYDLGRIDAHHERFVQGEVVSARAVSSLL